MKSLLSFVITALVVAGCEKSAFFAAENHSDVDLLLRYREVGGFSMVAELPASTTGYTFVRRGGATGWLEVLTRDCDQVGPDLTPAEFGYTVVVVDAQGQTSVIEKPTADYESQLTDVFDRCQ